MYASVLATLLMANSAAEEPVDWSVQFADMALSCVHLEYPNKIAHVMQSDADVKPPRELTPAFYGCFDWHSSVHGHWLLARLARLNPDAPYAPKARAALAKSLTLENLEVEATYLAGDGRASFERPYGLAWLLQLVAELDEWDDEQANAWRQALIPLELAAADRIKAWLPKLAYPIRVGEHSQTAFAFGLIRDWAVQVGDDDMVALIDQKSIAFYGQDTHCPLAYEPGGQDFLSPCLAEADLMRRVLDQDQFSSWLDGFLPVLGIAKTGDWLPLARITDRKDGKLAHLDGLNLSRAWMLEGIASALSDDDPRGTPLMAAAKQHREAGLEGVATAHYAGSHWLGSFATYLVTDRGL
ncbi:MAG: hypothetical protein DHS20C11_25400 [Lysobacteraceae bacterium]|nr:MAG: hypothetical protein DHS20C11_25400 [Xanthomonadaceae bacterium]